ncbi:MAG: hypothetical protein KDD63_20710 [Bacteroidetes bacterium]|nr:hypothetical protein [Bacteroidota bacterium]MCB0846779.1 hypothetical protein [Bacteroidota bacterium]MCB0854661.1 hypothetical protein [Bacteroidota bacterium]
MKDPLEQIIFDHKEELDFYEPNPDLWSRIHPEVEFPEKIKPPTHKRNLNLKVAATILLLIGLGSLFIWEIPSHIPIHPIADGASTADARESVDATNSEQAALSEFEAYYREMISARKAEIISYKSMGLETDHALFDQLEKLQHLYGDLQNELPKSENSEMVINAMAQNLIMQIEILNQQLAILKHIKSMQNGKEKQL